jgi:hypothetical protein
LFAVLFCLKDSGNAAGKARGKMRDEGGRMKDEVKADEPFFHPSSFRLHPSIVGIHIALVRSSCAAGAAGHGLPLFAPVSRRVSMKARMRGGKVMARSRANWRKKLQLVGAADSSRCRKKGETFARGRDSLCAPVGRFH